MVPVLPVEVLGELHHEGLAGGVDGEEGAAVGEEAADVEDGARPALHHARQHGPGHVQQRHDVTLHDVATLGFPVIYKDDL